MKATCYIHEARSMPAKIRSFDALLKHLDFLPRLAGEKIIGTLKRAPSFHTATTQQNDTPPYIAKRRIFSYDLLRWYFGVSRVARDFFHNFTTFQNGVVRSYSECPFVSANSFFTREPSRRKTPSMSASRPISNAKKNLVYPTVPICCLHFPFYSVDRSPFTAAIKS